MLPAFFNSCDNSSIYVSVFFAPWPHIYSKHFAYSIFSNLENDYNYLVSIGKINFAGDFINYQINVVFWLLSLLFLYVFFIPFFNFVF